MGGVLARPLEFLEEKQRVVSRVSYPLKLPASEEGAVAVDRRLADYRNYYVFDVFGRARCPACGHDFLVAYSCRARAVCPSCNARRMAETAAHLVDHVFPRAPVRRAVPPQPTDEEPRHG